MDSHGARVHAASLSRGLQEVPEPEPGNERDLHSVVVKDQQRNSRDKLLSERT